jgi:hypothetical protein
MVAASGKTRGFATIRVASAGVEVVQLYLGTLAKA